MSGRFAWMVALAIACGPAAGAQVRATDDAGREVVLAGPARRIVSLAPHATEMLFAAGAGRFVVGAVEHSDFPEAARRIPRVGDSALLDLEAIVAARPDLIVAWLEGNSERQLEKVRALGIPVFHTRPGRLADIPGELRRLGHLAGTEAIAREAADAFEARRAELERRYAWRSAVRVFYEVWPRPLLTVNGRHIISDAIHMCGGRNVFADADPLVPQLDVESVIQAAPEAVVRSGDKADARDAFATWKRLPAFGPTARGNLVLLETVTLGRHSPRILEGAALLCEALDGVRARRGRGGAGGPPPR